MIFLLGMSLSSAEGGDADLDGGGPGSELICGGGISGGSLG